MADPCCKDSKGACEKPNIHVGYRCGLLLYDKSPWHSESYCNLEVVGSSPVRKKEKKKVVGFYISSSLHTVS